jgi:heat shock protein HtpX
MSGDFDRTRQARQAQMTRHRHKSRVMVVALLGTITAVLLLSANLIAGPNGMVVAAALVAVGILSAQRVAPALVMQMFNAKRVEPHDWPEAYNTVNALRQRADIGAMPQLYCLPGAKLMAFSTGSKEQPVIALSMGALQHLSSRELHGIVAHELAHVASGDMTLLMMSEVMARLTRTFATLGLLLAIWLAIASEARVPLITIIILAVAPTAVSLLQLALSRNREYDADDYAADLTDDPAGLASGLEKIEREQTAMWRRLFQPYMRGDMPTLLRTHPRTADRVARLLGRAAE